ncbi:MAG: hypothetical protein AAF847_13890 [Bacteroidota bacterium]
MKFRLGKIASDIFVTFYVLLTLFFRFQLEAQLQGQFLLSIALGAFALLFLWALYRIGFIQPTWFGLHKGVKTN